MMATSENCAANFESNVKFGALHKVVLTGGPCGGKTTVQVVLSDVFENMGWKVYRVTETATLLLGGGVVFSQLSQEQATQFQLNLLKVMLSLEDTYMDLARADAEQGRNAIVICDRGAMDPSAYLPRGEWLAILEKAGLNEVSLRDERYDCVVHLVSVANGAEEFFSSHNNRVRSEGLEMARMLDNLVATAWIGHPYIEIIDNSTNFEEKKNRVVAAVLKRLGLDDPRNRKNISKRKFLIRNFSINKFNISGLADDVDTDFPVPHRDFYVKHDYLATTDGSQVRIRKRGSGGFYVYTVTHRRPSTQGQIVEIRRNIPAREYDVLLAQRDPSRMSVQKKRRCFLWQNRYYQLDVFEDNPFQNLVILEAYLHHDDTQTSLPIASGEPAVNATIPSACIPPFLDAERDVSSNPSYSMFQLSLIKK